MNKDEIFEKLCDGFDFSMTKEIMEYIDWPWYIDHQEMPIVDMRGLIKNLFNHLIDIVENRNCDNCFVSTAGFKVSYHNGIYNIEFIPVESEVVV